MNVTVAIPFRGGELDREIHKEYVQKALSAMLPGVAVYTVDSPGPVFSRAAARNLAVREAPEGVVVLCDADTLPEKHALEAAIKGADEDRVLHLPYRLYRALTVPGTLSVYARGIEPIHAATELTSSQPIGGIWVIHTQAWANAGGMDERFQGWGFEDNAFWTASETLNGPTVRHHGSITHLAHTSAANNRSPEYLRNKRLYQSYLKVRGKPALMRKLVGGVQR